MRAEYNFSKGKRGAIVPTPGKTRISIFIDNAILDAFRKRAEAGGVGYQTMMNEALKQFLAESEAPLTEARLRVVLDEALKGAESPQSSGATRKPAVKRRESIR